MLLAITGSVVYWTTHGSDKNDAETVQAGDCFQNTGTEKSPIVKKLDCVDPYARYKVLKGLDDQGVDMACDSVPGTTGALTQLGTKSFAVCFKDNK
ncbi:LppU/SCO3897 family protein [Streptomyces sp. NPDC054933]